MRQSPAQVALKHLRSIIGMSQSKFAELVGCSLPTIKALEGGKLALSHRLAERIGTETGVWFGWLLENDISKPPTTITIEGYPPFTADTFKLHREEMQSEVTDDDLLSAFSLQLDLLGAILRYRRRERKTAYAITRVNEEMLALVREFNVPMKEFNTEAKGRQEIDGILRETGLAHHYLGIDLPVTPPQPAERSSRKSRVQSKTKRRPIRK